MELRQLAVFVAVAEEMSLTRAAQRQNVVQSAVSATLRTLERQLGVALVARTTHKVELTDAGRVFLPEARRTLAAAQEARYVIQQVRGGLRGTLHLGIMLFTPAINVSPPRLISRFAAEYPNMEVTRRPAPAATTPRRCGAVGWTWRTWPCRRRTPPAWCCTRCSPRR